MDCGTITAVIVVRLHSLFHTLFPGSRAVLAMLCLLSLVACDGGSRETPQQNLPLPQFEHGEGGIQWRGWLVCADCEGIDTVLSLQRNGEERSFTLTETYMTRDEDVRFVDTGRWQRDRNLLRLQGLQGGRRVYALLADGRLQPRDGQGRRFPPREHDFLMPITDNQAP